MGIGASPWRDGGGVVVTIAEAYLLAVARFAAFDSPSLDAARIVAKVTGDDRARMVAHGDTPLDPDAERALMHLVERRASGVPLAYVVGSAGFYGRDFVVDERVLVPRPETEHAVEALLEILKDRPSPTICDIGTGSGAIAVTMACERRDASVFATDCSPGAIDVARHNAARNDVAQHCSFFIGDLAAPAMRFAPFDAVVANLPYVPSAEVAAPPDPVSYEPPIALEGGDDDGLRLYRSLVASLPALLGENGVAVFEAAPSNIRALGELISNALAGRRVAIGRDYASNERIVVVVPRSIASFTGSPPA